MVLTYETYSETLELQSHREDRIDELEKELDELRDMRQWYEATILGII
jgi:hypothetical protein